MQYHTVLGRWVSSQRFANKNGKITAANKRRLDKIGFKWKGSVREIDS
ncbi:MAG: helicase associated domain-containing protein [Schleiferiaceae bacterium]